jgi:hypothetical protein
VPDFSRNHCNPFALKVLGPPVSTAMNVHGGWELDRGLLTPRVQSDSGACGVATLALALTHPRNRAVNVVHTLDLSPSPTSQDVAQPS